MSAAEIDLEGLKREFTQALHADRKYERENDAKFRAVNQKVASYEEFRDIVKAAHLQPLERKDVIGAGGRKQPWNMACSSSGNGADGEKSAEELIQGGCGPPTNSQELLRQWRRYKGNLQEQYRLLVSIPKEYYSMTLKGGASTSLFGEMIVVLSKCFDVNDVETISLILKTFAEVPNFKLFIALLSKDEQQAIKIILGHLSSASWQGQNDLEQLYTIT